MSNFPVTGVMIMVHVRLLWLVLGLVFVTHHGKADELPSEKLANRPHVVMLVAEQRVRDDAVAEAILRRIERKPIVLRSWRRIPVIVIG